MFNWIGRPTNLCFPRAFWSSRLANRRHLAPTDSRVYSRPARYLWGSQFRVLLIRRVVLIFPPHPFVAAILDLCAYLICSVDLRLVYWPLFQRQILGFHVFFFCFRSFLRFELDEWLHSLPTDSFSDLATKTLFGTRLFLVVFYSFRAA